MSDETKPGKKKKSGKPKKKAKDKTPSKLELKAAQDPDNIFSFSIKCHTSASKADSTPATAAAPADTSSANIDSGTAKSVSDSGSDDVVLVSKDDEELDRGDVAT